MKLENAWHELCFAIAVACGTVSTFALAFVVGHYLATRPEPLPIVSPYARVPTTDVRPVPGCAGYIRERE